MDERKREKLACMMRDKPTRVKKSECKHSTEAIDEQIIEKFIVENKVDNKKYFDEDQVKSIWDLVNHSLNEDVNDERETETDKTMFEDLVHANYDFDFNGENQESSYEKTELMDLNESEDNSKENFFFHSMEWEHMYPVRKSLYNRKTHFISFLQNYTSYDMGRKLMSEYENNMCDFILSNMKPETTEDFLSMLKECKLSNVYRFYGHLFYWRNGGRCVNKKQSFKSFEIQPSSIDHIIHIFNMFQAFFHRQEKFNRKNFLSMRFLLGRILIFLKILRDESCLPIDLRRPKGKVQSDFHNAIWQQFLSSF